MRTDDEKPFYQVTAGLVRKNEKLLVAKRRKGSHLEGFWEFPGGKQEKGEALSECLERELIEELGISVCAVIKMDPVFHDYREKRIALHGFLCHWLKGDPKALQCQEIGWVTLDELARLKLPPPDVKIVRKLSDVGFFEKWMKGKEMFYKKNADGYKAPLEGVKLKSLTHGEKMHMCEFIIRAGSEIPEHSHPHEQTGYLVSGKLAFVMEGGTFDAAPGDSWSIPGNVSHKATALEDSVIIEVFSPVREEYF